MILISHHVLGLPKPGAWALCLVLFLAGEDGREGLVMGSPWRNVYSGAGDDLHLRPHQARDNQLLVNWWEILAPGRLLGFLITD